MSLLEVNKITPQSGTTLVLGDSGDTINFGSGVLPNFENLTVTGDLTVDTNSLKVDSANNYVGIGTASPSSALDIVGNIVVSGTVDGRDIATDGTKLDTIATNATANPNAIDNVVEDTTPQLGGSLDLNSNNITGTGNIDITGTVTSDGLTVDGNATFTSGNTSDQFVITNTDSGTNSAPDLVLYRNSSSPAANDSLGVIAFKGEDSAGNQQNYVNILAGIVDPTSGSEDAFIKFYTNAGGTTNSEFLRGESGVLKAFYQGSQKLETTSTGIDVTGTITFDGGTTSADLNFGDSDKAVFGAGSDLQIYHTGVDSFIRDAGTGNLRIQATNFKLENAGATQSMIEGYDGGAVDLRYAGATRLYTTTGGVFITGGIEMTANLDMGDNDKILLGSSDDLEIFHDGSNSYIRDVGTGDLRISGDNNVDIQNSSGTKISIRCQAAGAVNLYHDNSNKLQTTSSGINVTGTVTATSFSGDGSALTGISSGISWQSTPKTASFTAVSNEGYYIDTTSAVVTVTLPASPSVNDQIGLIDYAGNFATNKLIVSPNSLKIEGGTAGKQCETNRAALTLIYTGTTQGWVLESSNSGGVLTGISYNVEYVVVAGGGGGGGDYGGGGGAGGYRSSISGESSGRGASAESALTIVGGTTYTVTVGAGGSGGSPDGSQGGNSSFHTITSTGGGFGTGEAPGASVAGSGGSGGGGSYAENGGSGTTGQGYDGGNGSGVGNPYTAGGGGGAGAAGQNAGSNYNGAGGIGVASSVTGSSVYRAGGGGGGYSVDVNSPAGAGGNGGGGAGGATASSSGNAGTANTGGGGGGAGGNGSGTGGAGGSGVVILKVPTSSYSGTTTGSPTVTTVGSYKILTYTGSGSYTA